MKKNHEYRSWIFIYISILLFNMCIGVIMNTSFIMWVINHFVCIVTGYIEEARIKKHLKSSGFNMYAYRVKGGFDTRRRLENILMTENINDDIKVQIEKFLLSWKLWYIAAAVNFFSIFLLLRLNDI